MSAAFFFDPATSRAYFSAVLTAASWAFLSKVVTTRSPPPLIWSSENPSRTSSSRTICSRKPFGPPIAEFFFTSGNSGSSV